jgi:hypothetical protein
MKRLLDFADWAHRTRIFFKLQIVFFIVGISFLLLALILITLGK